MEDYMVTTGAGPQKVDYYDAETNTLVIRSNGAYPSGVLSNLCSNGFRFDGMYAVAWRAFSSH